MRVCDLRLRTGKIPVFGFSVRKLVDTHGASLMVLMRKLIVLEGIMIGSEDIGNVQYAPVLRG